MVPWFGGKGEHPMTPAMNREGKKPGDHHGKLKHLVVDRRAHAAEHHIHEHNARAEKNACGKVHPGDDLKHLRHRVEADPSE